MQGCHVLIHREGVSIDADVLADLFAALGDQMAEHCIAETLAALSSGVSQVSDCLLRSDRNQAARLALQISHQAATIGLTTLARIAGDVVTSCDRLHDASIASTVARLNRVADRSLAELCDLREALR